MITNKDFSRLLNLDKFFDDISIINLPSYGGKITRLLKDSSKKENFILNIDRGKINLSKIKYQTRYTITNDIMLRLDISGPRHQNPDGIFVGHPHIHIYKEGYGDKWAHPLNPDIFKDISNLGNLLSDFLNYFNVKNIPQIIYMDRFT